jgi:S-adenosylmethionine:tRNA ribosyltransferase-isomerase
VLQIEELRYDLQPENLEGTPREVRFGSRDLGRMLVVDRNSDELHESRVTALPKWLARGDVVVLNNSKRIPGVLRARTDGDGQVELRFVDLADEGDALCKVFPIHDVQPGSRLKTEGGGLVDVLEMGLTKYGLARVAGVGASLRDLLRVEGEPILGFFYDSKWGTDALNPYYAEVEGSVESPLAGLHFTPGLIEGLRSAGVSVEFVTLHSVGSWLPFLEDDVDDHVMWAEAFVVPSVTADAVNRARKDGRRVIACGSTSLRALESAVDDTGAVEASSGRTSLYVTPGYEFRCVTGYFTNFHQYQTSLMVLDASFAGTELVKRAYRHASERRFAFYEFGDAVLYL